MQKMIPLSKLRLSDSNVRKSSADQSIDQLASDIAARGLLQNLLVTQSKKRGHFDVFGGGRRLRAMQLLVERGEWNADHEAPCQVLSGDAALLTETSLAENFQRMAMTPADECRAFQHFMGADGSIDAVAKRFGVSRRFIEGRLRLAALAEPIFDALAAGEMTLDIAKAYASTDNHEKQLRVFATYGVGNNGYGNNADAIRRMIVQGALRGDDPIALLVGEEAYVAADGQIDRDLYSAKADDRWADTEIVERLAAEKLEAEAARIAATSGLAWIRPVASTDTWSARESLFAVKLPPAPLDPEEQAKIAEIDARLEEIESAMEDEAVSDEQYQAFEVETSGLAEARNDLLDRPGALPDEWKSEVGQFLKLARDGTMVLDNSYYSEKQIRIEQDEEGGVTGTFETRSGGTPIDKPAPRPEATAPGGKALSARLFDELAVQRRDILAANLVADPGLALDYAIFAMAKSAGYGELGTTIAAPAPQDPQVGQLPASRARDVLAQAHEALDTEWCETGGGLVARFEAFRALDDEAKAAWLAHVVANSLQAKPVYDQRHNPLQARLGHILDIDVASWWRPTAANFFDGVQKGSLLQLLHEVGGPNLSSRYAAAKKGEISTSCEKLFAGEAIVEDDIRERALAWVPNAMRFLDEAESQGSDPVLDAEEPADDDGGEDLAADPDAGEYGADDEDPGTVSEANEREDDELESAEEAGVMA